VPVSEILVVMFQFIDFSSCTCSFGSNMAFPIQCMDSFLCIRISYSSLFFIRLLIFSI
jgi:hypothetical protein